VEVGKLYVLLLNKTWHLDLVVCTTETENVYKEYCSFSGTCLTNFITLTESLYEDGANYVDSFLIKYFMAFVDNLLTLESFVVSKSIQLKTVNEALIKIKEAAIRTLFKVYNLLEWSELKKTIFNYLSNMLVKIDFTGLPEEFMVGHYKSNDGKYTMLGFGFEDVSTQYVIVDQLPTEDV
ncbi:MAG: hypothetical protein LLF94_11985, partial [Chlamydiales bacterium]|nr:hypothetical protein [Chlamydiales bacterium]